MSQKCYAVSVYLARYQMWIFLKATILPNFHAHGMCFLYKRNPSLLFDHLIYWLTFNKIPEFRHHCPPQGTILSQFSRTDIPVYFWKIQIKITVPTLFPSFWFTTKCLLYHLFPYPNCMSTPLQPYWFTYAMYNIRLTI